MTIRDHLHMGAFLHDLRTSLRALARSPGYAVACVAVLALGIGANTSIYSVVYAVILKPLPYPNVTRLVFVWEKFPFLPEPIGPRMQVQRVAYLEWQRQSTTFENMAAFQVAPLNEEGVERPRTISTGFASANLLPLLGVHASRGRLFRPEEEQKASDGVVVLSDAYFDQRFHRDPSALGQSITLGRAHYTVIGILPSRFHLPSIYEGNDQKKPDVWLPLTRLWNRPADDTTFQLYVVGLLKPGVSLDQARAVMSGLQARLNKSDAERYPATDANVFPFTVEDTSPERNLALYVLLGAVGFLLLIGCANLANLTMARARRRAREIAIRRAVGASRGRIVTQLLTESLLVSLAGAAVGVLLAQATIKGLAHYLPVPRPEDIGLNWSVFAFAGGVSILTTLLFGLAPAVTASAISVNEALKTRGGGGASAPLARSRQALTAAEVALALILLCGAGLLIRSFAKLVQIGVGFKTEQLAVANVNLPELRYPDAPSRARFYNALVQRARAIPGVAAAGAATTLPLRGFTAQTFRIAGRPTPVPNETPNADVANVSLDYFRVLGLPILAGHNFTADDVARNAAAKGDGVVIVNQIFATKFFSGQNPLGQRLLLENDRPFEIVGLVADFLVMGATSEARPQFFAAGIDSPGGLLLLRTKVPPESLSDAIRLALWSLDQELPAAEVTSMDHIVSEAVADERSMVVLLSVFAGLALLLAMIGVSSVLANLVASRTREIGIRVALGATPTGIGRMVAVHSVKPLAVGLVLGLAGSLALTRVLRSLLVGITPNDPVTLVSAIAAVVLVAPLAMWVPVRRATRVECTVALREE
jgi:putative ABC transport system permease protein